MSGIEDVAARIAAIIDDANFSDAQRKELLKTLVEKHSPKLPPYSTLPFPVIEEVQKATVGTGVVAVFKEHGVQKALLMKAGTHYQNSRYAADPATPTYMIPGGFINLTQTEGTLLTKPDDKRAEDPRTGAIRELEEELVNDQGQALLSIDPARLKPMDTKTLTLPWGERRVVIGFMLELDAGEAATLRSHVQRLEGDEAYRHAVRAHTVNDETDKPEVCAPCIQPLKEVVEGKHILLYPDQRSLFAHIAQALNSTEISR